MRRPALTSALETPRESAISCCVIPSALSRDVTDVKVIVPFRLTGRYVCAKVGDRQGTKQGRRISQKEFTAGLALHDDPKAAHPQGGPAPVLGSRMGESQMIAVKKTAKKTVGFVESWIEVQGAIRALAIICEFANEHSHGRPPAEIRDAFTLAVLASVRTHRALTKLADIAPEPVEETLQRVRVACASISSMALILTKTTADEYLDAYCVDLKELPSMIDSCAMFAVENIGTVPPRLLWLADESEGVDHDV